MEEVMKHPSEENIPSCKICKKIWKRKDADRWVYYDGTVCCLHHRGVQEWIKEKMNQSQKLLDNSTTS